MNHWELVKSLFEALDARGKKAVAREMMVAIRNDILSRHFPMPLHQAVDRFDNEYGDLVTKATLSSGVARFDGERSALSGTSDRTSRLADYSAKVARINADLLALYERFAPLLDLQVAPQRRPSGTWRDEEASQAVSDGYALATNEQLRAEYPAGAAPVEAVA